MKLLGLNLTSESRALTKEEYKEIYEVMEPKFSVYNQEDGRPIALSIKLDMKDDNVVLSYRVGAVGFKRKTEIVPLEVFNEMCYADVLAKDEETYKPLIKILKKAKWL